MADALASCWKIRVECVHEFEDCWTLADYGYMASERVEDELVMVHMRDLVACSEGEFRAAYSSIVAKERSCLIRNYDLRQC